MNKLKFEKSLYLKQHQENPVDWYPWCEEAFEDARKSNRPIMLSIGYSACHWCHVMAHESFEDEETAKLLNKDFINIKIDKEERPDLDKIYQMSQTIITGKNGGWPLTIFMDYNKIPFFGGTYFPKDDKYGIVSFKKILSRVSEFYKNNKNDIEQQNINVLNVFTQIGNSNSSKKSIDVTSIDKLKKQLNDITDIINGGFGSSPKFPHFPSLSFLIAYSETESEISKIKHTLDRMCVSGINDIIDGGFYRYTVDDLLMIPHFEKMLYDNGPMMSVLCDANVKFSDNFYLTNALSIYEWVNEFMTHKDGVFYSSMDADSDGAEGKYYVFTKEELSDSFRDNDKEIFEELFFDVNDKPNFEGKYHLHVKRGKHTNFKKKNCSLLNIFNKLKNVRKKRSLPGIDKKILLSWNCLYIKGLIKLYKITKDQQIFIKIKRAIEFILNNMVDNNIVYSVYHDEKCFPGYLDDYAFLSSCLLDYLTLEWNDEFYKYTKKICDKIINDFEDKDNGGYFFTSKDHQEMFYRPKSTNDDSLPAGIVYAADSLLLLGFISGETKYIDSAYKAVQFIGGSLRDSILSNVSSIMLLNDKSIQKKIIILRCNEDAWVNIKEHDEFYKKTIIRLNTSTEGPNELKSKKPIGDFTAYICQGMTCGKPITRLEDFTEFLNG